MKRIPPEPIEDKIAKRQRNESVGVPLQSVAPIQGDNFFMDIWQSIFNQCDGMAIVPLTLVCKRFHQQIKERDSELLVKYGSPQGLLERMVTSDKPIKLITKSLFTIVMSVAFIDGIDVKRIAKMFVRMRSTGLCNYFITTVAAKLTTIEKEAAGEIEDQLADLVLTEYAALYNHPTGSFPSNLVDFEKYLVDNEFDVWTEFPLSSFLMPLTYFSNSKILTEKILESVLLKIWKESFGEADTHTFDTWIHVRQASDKDSLLVNKFQCIAPYLSETAVQMYTKKFILIATTYHNCSNYRYHELFRLFLSNALDWTYVAHKDHMKGNLNRDRRAVCEESHNLKSLFSMAISYGIPPAPMMESIQKWLTLSSCTQTLRRTIHFFLKFNEQVQLSDEFSWLPSDDISLAAELLNSLAPSEKISNLIKSIWTVDCPVTRAIILELASKRTNETIQALQDFLIPLGWVVCEEKSKLTPLNRRPLGTLVGMMPSALSLRSLVEIFEFIQMPKAVLRAIALDLELIWLNRNDASFDATKCHLLLSALPGKTLQALARFLRLHWFLQPTLHLSGQLAEFYQLFPFLASNIDEGAVISKALDHKLGLLRMQANLRQFNLNQETFASNLASLRQ